MGRAGIEPATFCTSSIKGEDLLAKFREFQLIDLRRDKKTAYEKVYYVRKFLASLPKSIEETSAEDVRSYLRGLNGVGSATYKNTLGALKVFFRDFLKMPHVIASFKFPRQSFKPKSILTKNQLQEFYARIESVKEKALFLIYATSGLRREEILRLEPENIDFNSRMLAPNVHSGATKNSWVSFYNAETEMVLKEYLSQEGFHRSRRIFPLATVEERRLWKTSREKTGLDITPQRLREWFCCEMAALGVSDRYVDAFCGRTPKTILARNYTDYSPERLKQIYERANLKVFD